MIPRIIIRGAAGRIFWEKQERYFIEGEKMFKLKDNLELVLKLSDR